MRCGFSSRNSFTFSISGPSPMMMSFDLTCFSTSLKISKTSSILFTGRKLDTWIRIFSSSVANCLRLHSLKSSNSVLSMKLVITLISFLMLKICSVSFFKLSETEVIVSDLLMENSTACL